MVNENGDTGRWLTSVLSQSRANAGHFKGRFSCVVGWIWLAYASTPRKSFALAKMIALRYFFAITGLPLPIDNFEKVAFIAIHRKRVQKKNPCFRLDIQMFPGWNLAIGIANHPILKPLSNVVRLGKPHSHDKERNNLPANPPPQSYSISWWSCDLVLAIWYIALAG